MLDSPSLMPALVLPSSSCAACSSRDRLPDALHAVSAALPLSYAADAMTSIATDAGDAADVWRDIAVMAACTVAAIALGALTLRRCSA